MREIFKFKYKQDRLRPKQNQLSISGTNHNPISQLYAQVDIEEQEKQQYIELANKLKSIKLKREREEKLIL